MLRVPRACGKRHRETRLIKAGASTVVLTGKNQYSNGRLCSGRPQSWEHVQWSSLSLSGDSAGSLYVCVYGPLIIYQHQALICGSLIAWVSSQRPRVTLQETDLSSSVESIDCELTVSGGCG